MAWDIKVGTITDRTAIRAKYNHSKQNGIARSASTPNIMIYTDHTVGEQHDYLFDEWSDQEDDVFYYSGEGQSGDQTFVRGNAAILNHRRDGKALRLFEVVGDRPRGGKLQKYIGEFELEREDPYRFETVTRFGRSRRIIVFKLRAVDPDARSYSRAPGAKERPTEPRVVKVESNVVDTFEIAPHPSKAAKRREAHLMRLLEDTITQAGHEVGRYQIPLPPSGPTLLTDTLDATAHQLWEVKAQSDRGHVRMALGQLMDYLHHLPNGIRSGIVLPERPSDDLCELVRHAGHDLLVAVDGELRRVGADGVVGQSRWVPTVDM